MRSLNALVSRYWWTIVLRGVVALLFGVMTFAWPGATVAGLVLVFGAYSLVDGIAGVIVGIKNYGEQERWWATLTWNYQVYGKGVEEPADGQTFAEETRQLFRLKVGFNF